MVPTQAFGARLLLYSAAPAPVRPCECANDAAAGAHHARTKGRDRHVIAEAIHVQHSVAAGRLRCFLNAWKIGLAKTIRFG
jgi:hypothetical protein